MKPLPTLNVTGWSILDYELAFDGIRQVIEATTWLKNQPRAYHSAKGDYHPGGDFIVDLGEGWCSEILDGLLDSLRTIRFEDAAADERRVLLLIRYEVSWGVASDPLSQIIQRAINQL
jgi:hypothetical protein